MKIVPSWTKLSLTEGCRLSCQFGDMFEKTKTQGGHISVCVMCLCEWFSGGKDIANELQVAAEGKQTNSSSGSYYIITNRSLGCSQTNTSEPRTSLKNACWRGRTVGSAGGWWGWSRCDRWGKQTKMSTRGCGRRDANSCGWSYRVRSSSAPEWATTGSVVGSESSVLSLSKEVRPSELKRILCCRRRIPPPH